MTSTESDAPNELVTENEALREESQRLREENALLRKALYGTSSEKMEKPPETESQPATFPENQNDAVDRDREKTDCCESSEGQEENSAQEGVLVLNARDDRVITWLIDQAGFEAVQQACGKIAGNRKLYPTNLAKVLGLSIPQSIIVAPSSVARERIRDLLTLLSSHQDRG